MKWILFFIASNCYGQSQDVQQLMLNIEKLAQMKATYQSIVNGYQTLKSGYERVSNLAKGNFDLHREYLDGLLAVSPAVRQYGKIDAVILKQKSLVVEYHETYRLLQLAGMLRADEMIQLKNSLGLIVRDAESSIDEMIEVLTPGKLRMNDQERLTVINTVDAEISAAQEKLRSVAPFNSKFSNASDLE